MKRLWAEALGGAESGPVTRKTDKEDVPWFEMVYAKPTPRAQRHPGEPATFRTWLMEYDAGFLTRWYPDLTRARSITRGDVLDRYVASIGKAARREEFLMKDVVALTLALEPGGRDTLVKEVRVVPWVGQCARTPTQWCAKGQRRSASA